MASMRVRMVVMLLWACSRKDMRQANTSLCSININVTTRRPWRVKLSRRMRGRRCGSWGVGELIEDDLYREHSLSIQY